MLERDEGLTKTYNRVHDPVEGAKDVVEFRRLQEELDHAVAVKVSIDDGVVSCDAGNGSCANASARPNVSLLWPPATANDYSLIVDGRASVDGSTVRVVPSRAVRHRPAPGGGNDCVPIPLD